MSVKKFNNRRDLPIVIGLVVISVFVLAFCLVNYTNLFSTSFNLLTSDIKIAVTTPKTETLDFADYDRRMFVLATASSTISFAVPMNITASSTGTSTIILSASSTISKKTIYPNVGAILPFKRVVAYYGNFLSTGMGVLGQYPAPEMLEKLRAEVAKWEAADPTTPVMPAIDYIAVTAQGSAGASGKDRAQMPDKEIDHALDLAAQVNGIVILEIQAGLSTVQSEIPLLEKYLKMPQVHLALDPEFYMKTGAPPGTVVGTMDAKEINYAANYLADLVRANNLPPKVLIVHRYTYNMVTNYKNITPLPEVQIVMDMDGWGSPARKNTTYSKILAVEPVQFTGFKLFYKNDILAPSPRMMTPEEVLNLKPRPSFIQYQ